MAFQPYPFGPLCGCWRPLPHKRWDGIFREFLPLLDVAVSTTILARTSRTTFTQTMLNPSKTDPIEEVRYTFPLYDGATVVGFKCTVGQRTITGVVKGKQQARADYDAAVGRGETAGLLEQLPESSDVSTTRIGNVPPNGKVVVEIVYLGELKHDAETDGSRFTIPTQIAPRYGNASMESTEMLKSLVNQKNGIKITVDVTVEDGSAVRSLQSPSHPIAVTIGRTSAADGDAEDFDRRYASATLALGSTELEKDFVVVVKADGIQSPKALLETHALIPNQKAVMATLVPKFNLPNSHPEIVFVVDRSGSMGGKIETLVSAMRVFLKSLPLGVKFNICSFGSRFDFLFKRSRSYDDSSLAEAEALVNRISADYGGTEMLEPIKEVVKNGYKDMPLEVMVITDGEIWGQEELFSFINEAVATRPVRFFSLGIGSGASSSLVEGIARAGGGFAQFVSEGEKMDKKVVRMLKGALMPQIKDYTLEVQYESEKIGSDDDFEMVEGDSASGNLEAASNETSTKKEPSTISFFDPSAVEEPTNPPGGRYDHLPITPVPDALQTPHKIPGLYPFSRTSVYIILSEKASRRQPNLLILRGESEHGPLELKFPVQDIGKGQTIHQLAAKKAVQELEEGRGWIVDRKNEKGELLKTAYEGRFSDMVEEEARRLGVRFQVGGKWCSFVAVEKNADGSKDSERDMFAKDDPALGNLKHDMFLKVSNRQSFAQQCTPSSGPPSFGASNFGATSFKSFYPDPTSFGASRAPHMFSAGSLSNVGTGSPPAVFGTHSPASVFGTPSAASAPFAVSGPASTPFGFGAPAPASTPFGFGSPAHASVPFGGPSPATGSARFSTFGTSNVEAPSNNALFGSRKTAADASPSRRLIQTKGRTSPEVFQAAADPGAPEPFVDFLSGDTASGLDEDTSQPPRVATDEEKMHDLIAHQKFNGSWSWTSALLALLGTEEKPLLDAFSANLRQTLAASSSDEKTIMATIAAVVFFEVRLRQQQEVWEMVVDKARGWVQKLVGSVWDEEASGVAKLFSLRS